MNKIKLLDNINTSDNKNIIDERLHGQFIEFLGECISGGIWVGDDSDIPNYQGLRKEAVDALKEIAPPVLRFPGGCFADTYHWRNGIGAPDKRPVTYNTNFGTMTLEYNQFGTHEFIKFCRLIGAEPWININMLSGTVAEMCEWAEYCNRSEETDLSLERRKNGSPEPFNVEYWGIGNESWAGGGNYTAAAYADEYRKYASAFPRFGNGFSPKEKMIACGPDGNKPQERVKWTKEFFESLKNFRTPPIYGYDLHFYNWNISHKEDTTTSFSKEDWYRVIAGAGELETIIEEQYDLLQEGINSLPPAQFGEKDCKLIVGEWGNWHGKSFEASPALYQQCTMRDAVTTALTLDIFHRQCDKVSMACNAQTVNVLNSLILTEGSKTILTPNYYVFKLYMPHRGARKLDISIESPQLYSGVTDVSAISAFASEKEGLVTLNVVNSSYDEKQHITFDTGLSLSPVDAKQLSGKTPQSYNSFENPDNITIKNISLPEEADGSFSLELPPASITVYQFKIN